MRRAALSTFDVPVSYIAVTDQESHEGFPDQQGQFFLGAAADVVDHGA
jgi:hypothetical protein